MMSNLLTPDQKLAVAQEVMPLPKDNDWFLMNVGESIYSTRHGYWNPDTNTEQWKALALFCLVNDISFHRYKNSWQAMSVCFIETVLTHENLTDCMQAAVLAYLQTQSPEEKDDE